MITRLLVANRGEIARRVFRTCRDLGIATVAVFSDADAESLHVAEADVAVRLPGSAPAETYLRGDLIIAAAFAAGADAIHPGYGFLSENAGFALAVVDAGLTWVGPPPAAITAMGSKVGAKALMAEAGVPLLGDVDPDSATESDLPLLVKASAGGGGRGMRIVRTLDELPDAVASARREAGSAFGDDTVFCEPLVEKGRHVEVQVLADAHGTVWTLGERECSIQRRHQKIVEETPSPAVNTDLRAALSKAAVQAAEAIGYVGAGTVEFLLAADGRFFFLEVNTRLQVEHPVTECVYGLDLVRWQIEIADGDRLPAEPPTPSGHAIEVRLYAEDPAAGWRPQSGRLHRFEVSDVDAEFEVPGSAGLRLDSGVVDGSEVGIHYDPMLAKVIAFAPSRGAAIRRLAAALRTARIHGVRTNRDLLVRVLTHPAFVSGETDTGFLDRHDLAALAAPLADSDTVTVAALAAALADAAANRATARVLGGVPSGWRNVPSQPQRKTYVGPDREIVVSYRLGRDGLRADDHVGVTLVAATPDAVVLERDGLRTRYEVSAYPGVVYVDWPGGSASFAPVPLLPDPSAHVAPGSLLAPMPGTVIRVAVSAGASVTAGQPLLWLEAMKMEHVVSAPVDGVVSVLNVSAGQQVDVDAVLAIVDAEEES